MNPPEFIRKLKSLSVRRYSTHELQAHIAGVRDFDLRNGKISSGKIDLAEDGQIEFKFKNFIVETSAVVHLRVEAISHDFALTPRTYIDFGLGYSQLTSIAMMPCGKNAWECYVATPHLVNCVRVDLTEEAGIVDLKSIVAQRAPLTGIIPRLIALSYSQGNQTVHKSTDYILELLGAFAEQISHGDEKNNHRLIASALTLSLNYIPAILPASKDRYLEWIEHYETLTDADREWMSQKTESFIKKPVFSILMPVYSPPLDLLSEAIESLLSQTYPHWELCIADDASDGQAVRRLIEKYSALDSRIKFIFREENGHISRATNSAAALATGDFLVLMDNDDLLPSHALYTAAYYIDANPGCRMLFSDEDKISTSGFRCEPYYKGAFDRFLMYGHNMFSHLGIYARDLFELVGGFRVGFEGSQDYDLTLRCMELCTDAEIVHIPHVLYHWRQIPGSTSIAPGEKSYAFTASKRAINDHFERKGYFLESVNAEVPGVATVRTLYQPNPAEISIIIPTKDGLEILRPCIDSLMVHPDPMTQIVIVDNGSEEDETLEYLRVLARDAERFTVVRDDSGFNFSRLVNLGVAHSRGEIICLLNNDTELLSGKIYERARAWLAMPDVGIVGARLLYPDHTVQHFGVYVGVGAHKVADHPHLRLSDHTHAQFSKSRLLQQFSAVTAACLFVRKSDYNKVGGFDEGLAVAYNDIDFCLRVQQAGFKIVCDPEIKLIHKESKTRGDDNNPSKAARLDGEAAIVRNRWGGALNDPFYNSNFSSDNARFEIASKARFPIPWKKDFG
ncbi:glycosyltransferase family 2 protein [Methylobacterium sp. E-025]|uniref:glycosyltransferase family 2 protein n=1 Tax=Methylobacterium sp. E-025 TaxID=2836561 RepID=UPI001FB9B750|nr:glycosyltransferase family 2 protein [Methylobacterium sp. E-025]MCJ2114268.1 glycosyltransferase family 2 protein [Methylobacterium sp. E-025]